MKEKETMCRSPLSETYRVTLQTRKSLRQILIKSPNNTAASTSRQPSIAAMMSIQEKPVLSISSLKKEGMRTQIAPPSGKSSSPQ